MKSSVCKFIEELMLSSEIVKAQWYHHRFISAIPIKTGVGKMPCVHAKYM